jgi:FixJ family two-component response regulator
VNARSNQDGPVVVVVEDDDSLRGVISSLLRSVGLRVETFGSAKTFLGATLSPDAGCLILDIRLPGRSGLDLQADLLREDIRIPIIFISGHGDVPMTVKAMKAGAVDLLTKPFRHQDLLDAVTIALDLDRKRRDGEEKVSTLQTRFESLTNREQQIMGYVTSGLMNKQIAHELSLAEITVKIHRSNVMRKMGAKTFAELVRMAETIGSLREKTKRL